MHLTTHHKLALVGAAVTSSIALFDAGRYQKAPTIAAVAARRATVYTRWSRYHGAGTPPARAGVHTKACAWGGGGSVATLAPTITSELPTNTRAAT